MRNYLFLFLSLIYFPASAQDITGIWRGHFISSNKMQQILGREEERYKFEVQVDQNDKAFKGVTYSYKTTVFYGKASCYGTVNLKTKKVLLEEMQLLELKMASGSPCIMTCFLQYAKMGDEEVLEGTYTSMNTGDSTNCGRGTVFLRKVNTSDFHKEPFLVDRQKKKPAQLKPADTTAFIPKTPMAQSPVPKTIKRAASRPVPAQREADKNNIAKAPLKKTLPPIIARQNKNLKVVTDDSLKNIPLRPNPAMIVPQVLASRKNELIKTITTSAREISINIYDNGTIDNDTVSVYMDNKLVISKQRLTEKAITVTFSLDEKANRHELVMVAENLGEIPPNTSLMVVNAGTEQFEVRITSTEQKNAVVIFQYQPLPARQ